MRSETSFFNGTVFKKTVTRFWPVWAAYFVIWFISLPLNGLMMLSVQAAGTNRTTDYMENFACRTVPGMAGGSLVVAAVFGLLAAMAVCSHLYNSKSTNFFGSLPIRREGLFTTHYLAGLGFLIVPNVIIALLTLAIEAAGGWVSMEGLLFWLGVSCGEGFLFYSMAVFCAMFTGHILALPVFYGVFNVLALGIWYLGNSVLQAFYYGYVSGDGLGYRAAYWLTPAWKLESEVYSVYNTMDRISPAAGAVVETEPELVLRGLPVVGAYVLAAAVLTVCAFFLYRARRLESAGDVVSVQPMRPVFKYGVAICTGLALGLATCTFLNTREAGLMISVVIWGIVGCFAAQMLLDKSFRVFKKWKGAAAVTGVFIALFLVMGMDLTGFETRIPDPASVEWVYVTGLDAMGLGDSADYLSVSTTDPGQIGLLVDLHRAAVEQRDGYTPTGGMVTSLRRSTYLRLIYQLKDGSKLSRRYTVWLDPSEMDQEGTAAWALEQLYADRDLYWEAYGFADLERLTAEEGWWLEQAQYDYNDYNSDEWNPSQYYYGKDAQALYEAVKEDFLAGRIGVRSLNGVFQLGKEGYYYKDYDRYIRFKAVNSDDSAWSFMIFVQDSASSTIAALEQLGAQD